MTAHRRGATDQVEIYADEAYAPESHESRSALT